MKFYDNLSAILAGSAIASAIVITLPSPAAAMTGEEINDIAREVTVLIKGKEAHGSGVIIAKDDKTYYVLTANHVVSEKEDYKIVTADKKAHKLDYEKVKRLPGVDLAVVEFSSDNDYKIAKLGNSDSVTEGKSIFVSGWPKQGEKSKQLVRQFTYSRVSGFLEQPIEGYQMIYTNVTLPGMSGGPVVDAAGRVVAIHGMGDTVVESQSLQKEGFSPEAAAFLAAQIKSGFNYAIPIKAFLSTAPQAGIFLSLQVENSPSPAELGTPYVASTQPDERDTIDDINNVLNTVDKIRNVGCRLGICF